MKIDKLKTDRPWGSFEVLYESSSYKVKKIIVNPNQALSLQYHNHRFEDWVIVEGSGMVCDGDETRNCIVGDRFHISPKKVHRATAGMNGLTFIEIQRGICDEDDIIRIEDNYGRN